jgi:hypothetical protein
VAGLATISYVFATNGAGADDAPSTVPAAPSVAHGSRFTTGGAIAVISEH